MHVHIWRCEHAMFCVEILMYQISVIHASVYINDACTFIFVHYICRGVGMGS